MAGRSKRRDQGTGTRDQRIRKVHRRGEPDTQKPAKKKLSYLEAREFAAIEQRVEESDARLAAARDRVEDPAIASDAAALQAALVELESAQEENDLLYARWAELTEKASLNWMQASKSESNRNLNFDDSQAKYLHRKMICRTR